MSGEADPIVQASRSSTLLPNGLPYSSVPDDELETIMVCVPATRFGETIRSICVWPRPRPLGLDFEVLGFISHNDPGEILIRSVTMAGKLWGSVDPHIFHYVKAYPFYPLKTRGVIISKTSPLEIEFVDGSTTRRDEPPALKLGVVGRRMENAGRRSDVGAAGPSTPARMVW